MDLARWDGRNAWNKGFVGAPDLRLATEVRRFHPDCMTPPCNFKTHDWDLRTPVRSSFILSHAPSVHNQRDHFSRLKPVRAPCYRRIFKPQSRRTGTAQVREQEQRVEFVVRCGVVGSGFAQPQAERTSA